MIGIIRRILKPIAAWVLKEEMEGAERTINNQTTEIKRLSVEMAKTKEELKMQEEKIKEWIPVFQKLGIL